MDWWRTQMTCMAPRFWKAAVEQKPIWDVPLSEVSVGAPLLSGLLTSSEWLRCSRRRICQHSVCCHPLHHKYQLSCSSRLTSQQKKKGINVPDVTVKWTKKDSTFKLLPKDPEGIGKITYYIMRLGDFINVEQQNKPEKKSFLDSKSLK